MTYILTDNSDTIVNIIEWDGREYNPAPFQIRDWKDGCAIGLTYETLTSPDVDPA